MKNFPKKIQFWTRFDADTFHEPYIRENRIDLKFPHIYYDNRVDQNVLTIPDHYNLDQFIPKILGCKLRFDQAPDVPWD